MNFLKHIAPLNRMTGAGRKAESADIRFASAQEIDTLNTHQASEGVSRRAVLAGGGALVLTTSVLAASPSARAAAGAVGHFASTAADEAEAVAFNLFLEVRTDDTVVFTCHRSEMGQQIRTGLAMVVADEMGIPLERLVLRQALGDPKYGDQNTDGSRSIRREFTKIRKMAASARVMLEEAAAKRFKVPASELVSEGQRVHHKPSGRSESFGALALDAGKMPMPDTETLRLKPRSEWQYIGTHQPSIDLEAMLTGQATFGMDVQLEGMKVAVIARPPVVLGKVASFDDSDTLRVNGVRRTVLMPALSKPVGFNPLGGVAVIADHSWAAIKGRRALKIEWDEGDNAGYDTDAYLKTLAATAQAGGTSVRSAGDVKAALASADTVVEATYAAPHLAQSPMEPPVATARPTDDGGMEIWASTQNPQAVRDTVAALLGIKPEQVIVHVTFLGGGFGRKSKADYSAEAAYLAREIGGAVKVMWTREDDVQHGYYHSISAQHIRAGLDASGKVTAWQHTSAFPSIVSTFDGVSDAPSDFELDLGFTENPFDIANMELMRGKAPAHVRIGWLRSVCNIYHAFAVQSFAAELAVKAGRDQRDFLLELIGPDRIIDLKALGTNYGNYGDPVDVFPLDTARMKAVLRDVANRAGWDSFKQGGGHGLGIAVHRSFLTYVATAVEVQVIDGAVKVKKAWVSIDAGTVVNKEHVKAQCEGGTIYGLSAALMSSISVKDGKVVESNFHDYLVARMPDAPHTVDVNIIESTAAPAGVGEPSTPPVVPALANAIFNATGKRLRTLPVGDQLSA